MEAIDKGGNFIGWLFVDGMNLSVALVEAGLAKVHFTAERSPHFSALMKAQEQAKSGRLKVLIFIHSIFKTPWIKLLKFLLFSQLEIIAYCESSVCSIH